MIDAEFLVDGVDGFLTPARAVGFMGNKVALLFENDGLRRQMASNARARAVEHFDIGKQGESCVSLYKSLLQE